MTSETRRDWIKTDINGLEGQISILESTISRKEDQILRLEYEYRVELKGVD